MSVIRYCIFLIVFAVVSSGMLPSVNHANAQSFQDRSVASDALKSEVHIGVWLPASYTDQRYGQRRYPVIFLLDGSAFTLSTTGIVDHLSSGHNGVRKIPEAIIISIDAGMDRTAFFTPTDSNTDHEGKVLSYDEKSGEADLFFAFMKDDLLPLIESEYRVQPHRTIIGHSLGGVAVLHALMEHPNLFQAHVAIDASLWWDDGVLTRRLRDKLADNFSSSSRVYIALAEHRITGQYDGSSMIIRNKEFSELLTDTIHEQHKFRYFDGEDHGTVPLIATYYGLQFVFDGYQAEWSVLMDGPEALTKHFSEFSRRLNVEFAPTEILLDETAEYMSAYYAYTGEDRYHELAEAYFRFACSQFPNSTHAQEKLRSFLADSDQPDSR